MDEQLVNRIAEILGQSGNAVVAEYVWWHLAKALLWISLSVAGAWLVIRWKQPDSWVVPHAIWKAAVVAVLVIVGGCHFPDVVAPRAISIHQLLIDIRG